MPALFRRKIQGTEKGKRSGGKPLSGLIKVLTYRHRGKGYAVSGENNQSGYDHRGREILFEPV